MSNAEEPKRKMPKEKAKPDKRLRDMKEKFLDRAAELWKKHESEFVEILDESESHKLNLSFSAKLDFSESSAVLDTTLSFSQVMTDKTSDTFDDPNQGKLPLKVDEKPKSGKDAAAGKDN